MNKQNLLPADIARRGKISEGALSKILNGERRPTTNTITAIADSLGVSRAEAFYAAGLIEKIGNNDQFVDKLALRIGKLPREQQKFIDALIDTILSKQGGLNAEKEAQET